MITCKRRSSPYRTNSFIVAWLSALLVAKCFTRTFSLGLHHLKGTGKQSPSLASHVELIFFTEHVCWAARPMGRDRTSVPRPVASIEKPFWRYALDARSNYPASLWIRQNASAV